MLDPELQKHAAELEKNQIPYAIATVVRAVSPTAGKPGDKALVTAKGDIYGWIGGGCAQPAVIKSARLALKINEPSLIRVTPGKEVEVDNGIVSFHSSCPSGGTLDIFIEPMFSKPVLWVLGSSPAAEKLVALGAAADFDVKVAAPLGELAQFPMANAFFEDFNAIADNTDFDNYIVIATQGKRDKAAIEAALKSKSHFIGFVASAKKAVKYKEDFIERGFDKNQVDNIVAPVGIDLCAKSPTDIALSILAQITKFKNASSDNEDIKTDACDKSVESNESNRLTKTKESKQVKSAKKASGGCCGS